MNAITIPNPTVDAPAYLALQREMHDALLAQHPEWIESDGNSPKCDDYDQRFAQLLNAAEMAASRSGLGRAKAARGSVRVFGRDWCEFAPMYPPQKSPDNSQIPPRRKSARFVNFETSWMARP